MSTEKSLSIEICMGSSCFSRGNQKALEILKSYIQNKRLESQVDLKGTLCRNQCSNGPVMKINGKVHKKVDPVTVIDILEEALRAQGL